MSSYAPNYTARYRCHYRVCGIEHAITLRKAIGATIGDANLLAGTVGSIFTAAAARLANDFTFLSAEVAGENSDIFTPATLPNPVTGTLDVATFTPFQKVTHTRFGGKAFGSRASLEMYGIFWQYSNEQDDLGSVAYDGIVTSAEVPFIGTIAGLLNTQAYANSGGPTVWYPRATVKVNDYWLRQVRKGGIS